MPDVAKLKKKAAEFELKKQFDKALAVYVEILDGFDKSDEEVDVSLFNRVGDLYLKQGSVGDAVDYYEQAVDLYAESGFHNNAIALCNKILRNSPGRASVYYKLGKISAQKGFKGDAKKNFLEYADRMQSSGKIDEAFRALKEFADLCPDQDDIRLMLAEQLSKKGRTAEAIEQLQLLYVRYSHEGRGSEAKATIARMKAIDPDAEPRELGDAPRRNADDLVFLDLSDSPSRRMSSMASKATRGLELLDTGAQPVTGRPSEDPHATPIITPTIASPVAGRTSEPIASILDTPELEPAVLDGVTRADDFDRMDDAVEGGSLLEGLETTSFASDEPDGSAHDLLDFEPTSFGRAAETSDSGTPSGDGELLDFDLPEPAAPAPTLLDELDFGEIDLGAADAATDGEEDDHSMGGSLLGLPMLVDDEGHEPDVASDADDEGSIGGDLELIMPDGTPARGSAAQDDPPVVDIPLMDFDLPHPGEAAASIADVSAPERVELPVERVQDADIEPEAIDDIDDSMVGDTDIADDELRREVEDAAAAAASAETQRDLELIPTPPATRRHSTVIAARDVDLLRALCDAEPEDHATRRRLAEAMLESGDREGGVRELETAMVGFERSDDLLTASKVADEIVLLNPESLRHHQKRVEYAFRTNERGRLIEAYIQLADALFRAGQVEKSRAIYQRVIDLSPDDDRAQTALDSFPEPEPEPAPAPAPPKARQTVGVVRPAASAPPPPSPVPMTSDDEYINLGDWLRDDEAPKDTRMIVDEKEPTGDEEADFQDMLKKFKQGIAENVEEEDHQSHYDLGVAYKEMGLLDEAIAEFQKALRAPANRVPTYEALGLCFIEKEQFPMAATILGRALHEPGMNESQLIGVLYLLGRCAQERGQRDAAIEYYQRVFVVDIQFQDVGERLAAVEGAAS
ncbi:MAG: tetratricopeptide repeat protein [bacterium]